MCVRTLSTHSEHNTQMQTQHHAKFLALHQSSALLLLPNAWDAASAKLFESTGAKAIATSSAAVAWSLGYADGGQLPTTELIGAVKRIVRVLSVPLTVDIENGYSDDPKDVAALARALVDAGAAGINIEDGAQPSTLLAEKIHNIRNALTTASLFINARTDVYLKALAPVGQAVAITIERLDLYREAGADGAFVPGLSSLDDVHAISAAIALPLNVMLVPNLPDATQLHAAGVKRITAGPAPFVTAYGDALDAVSAFRSGDFSLFGKSRLDFRALNAMFSA
jgi:2-methylisocitrate lyase-like PEP mutase family enzyme